MRANLLCKLNIKCTFSTRLPTSFPGFSPTCPTGRERERETLVKNPGNEVTRRSKILESSLSAFSVVTDRLKNLLRFCSLCQVLCRKWRRRENKTSDFLLHHCISILEPGTG